MDWTTISVTAAATVTASLLWYLKPLITGPGQGPPRSVQVGPSKEGQSRLIRHPSSVNGLLVTPEPEIQTLYDLGQWCSKKYARNNCTGKRNLIKNHIVEQLVDKIVNGQKVQEKKKWTLFEMGPYQWLNYSETFQRISQLSSGLIKFGARPKSKLAIYCNSCPEWMMTSHACFAQSISVVTMYANLGDEAVLFGLQDTKAEFILTSGDLLLGLAKKTSKLPNLKGVIYFDEVPAEALAELKKNNIRAISFDELVNLGKENPAPPSPPTPEDIAVIMYTSGSTGLPKGVLITHKNLVSVVAAAKQVAELRSDDVYMAYLPLAHVLELAIETACLFSGTALGYGNPRTLTAENMKNCLGDLQELKPTLMAGVPAVWTKVAKGITAKVSHSSSIARKVFWAAVNIKKRFIEAGMSTPILDKIVFNKVKTQVGGRLRIVLSGGAPIHPETQTFLRVVLCCPVIQGYGLTETTGASCILPVNHLASGRVGAPLPCVEMKLVDIPEMGYLSTNKPYPQGEIWFGGPTVTKGYYNAMDKTKEVYFDDYWFSTGDIGQLWPDGTISIIDRKKNLVKMSHGEYIALEKLEAAYSRSPFLDNICVYGDSQSDFAVAVGVPNRKAVQEWAEANGKKVDDVVDLFDTQELKKAVLDSLSEIARSSSFKPIEFIQGIYLCHEEWTPENELLTAAMKLKRQDIYKTFKPQLQNVYASLKA